MKAKNHRQAREHLKIDHAGFGTSKIFFSNTRWLWLSYPQRKI